jgi:transcriptional regulator with XRE-family HTH domain
LKRYYNYYIVKLLQYNIARLAKKRKISRREISLYLGYPDKFMDKIFSDTCYPNSKLLGSFCSLFKVSPKEFFRETREFKKSYKDFHDISPIEIEKFNKSETINKRISKSSEDEEIIMDGEE